MAGSDLSAGQHDKDKLTDLSERELLQLWIDHKDQEAATELYRRYVQRLLKQAGSLRASQNYVEESAYLSAFGSVLRRAGEMKFYFDHDDWLWRLLATISKRKMIARYRRQKELTGGDALSDVAVFAEGDPTPDEVATFNDLRRELWAALQNRERVYLEMREQGFNQKEIAAEMKVDPRQVRRIARAVEVKASRLFKREAGLSLDDKSGLNETDAHE